MAELLRRLEGQPRGEFVVLGVSEGGHELRAARRDRGGTVVAPGEVVPPLVSVCVDVPEPPQGRVEYVMCTWEDSPDSMAYLSLQDGAVRPDWTRLKLTRTGIRFLVRWKRLDEPRVYDYAWTTTPARRT